MSGGTLAWGIAFAVLCVITGILIGWPIGHARGLKHAAEDAEDAATAAVVAGWKGLPDEDARPAPPWPDAPPQAPRAGPGKHRHPAGPRHAALPAAGRLAVPEPDPWRYLPAPYTPGAPGRWNGTITVPAPAPVQSPPWETPPPEPEPPTQVLEPTAADCLRPDALTDTGWTRHLARQLTQEMDADIERMEQDMDAWIAEHITATDSTLKQITR